MRKVFNSVKGRKGYLFALSFQKTYHVDFTAFVYFLFYYLNSRGRNKNRENIV